jgi:hypothetical protein
MLDPVGYGVCGSYHLLEYSRCRRKGAYSNNFNPPEESQRSKYGLGLKVRHRSDRTNRSWARRCRALAGLYGPGLELRGVQFWLRLRRAAISCKITSASSCSNLGALVCDLRPPTIASQFLLFPRSAHARRSPTKDPPLPPRCEAW